MAATAAQPMQPPPQQRMTSPQLTAPAAGQSSSMQAVAGTPTALNRRGFTQSQLNVLRNQILAFRRIKVSICTLFMDLCLTSCKQGFVLFVSN